MGILGIDTSNYTTSAALLLENGIEQSRQLLPVSKGARGIRQSDAVFHHTLQLPVVINKLQNLKDSVEAIGVSAFPRGAEGSYMPCFKAGESAAEILSHTLSVPLYKTSHQAGHIAAALYSAKREDLFGRKFLAFHVSGGTTDGLLVSPDEKNILNIRLVSKSLDLKAGQAIDRCGVMLGLSFPCGAELEKLSLLCGETFSYNVPAKGADVSFSGIENKCAQMIKSGQPPENTAAFCLFAVLKSLQKMCEETIREYGEMPVLFAGGVSSNKMINRKLSEKFGAVFAQPEFSCDNAAGTAVLCREAIKRGII